MQELRAAAAALRVAIVALEQELAARYPDPSVVRVLTEQLDAANRTLTFWIETERERRSRS